jgi:hypothetical protein
MARRERADGSGNSKMTLSMKIGVFNLADMMGPVLFMMHEGDYRSAVSSSTGLEEIVNDIQIY